MKCSVVIPTRHRPALLRETLESLSQQTESGFDVIVVVDGEDSETRSLADTYKASYPLRWFFVPEHKGQASARNAGAAAAESEILIFLDDDTRPARDWVHHHMKHHRANNGKCEIGVFGKVVDQYVMPPRSRTEQHLRDSRDSDVSRFEDRLKKQGLEFGKVVSFGLNTSLLRKAFFAVDGFDPKLNYIDEDADLGARLCNYGLQFKYEPDAIVYHRDKKNRIDYHYSILRCGGRFDVYRRREKGQINGRLQLLAQMHNGSPLRKLVHRTAWYAPWAFRLAGAVSNKATDLTGSRLSYRLWYKTGVGEYWKGVREAGETLRSLRGLYPLRAPILMLHSITKPDKQNLKIFYLSPERFKRFMGWLKRARYTSVLPIERQDSTAPGRRVILTFDDAYDDFLSEAFPVLDRIGFKATVFVVVDRIGKTNEWDVSKGFRSRHLLSIEQIRELHRHGVHFGSHTLTHTLLTDLSNRDLEREVRDSKHKLEDLLGSEVPCFSYPWGAADMRVRAAVARAGYKVAVSTAEGLNDWEDSLYLKRVNLCEVDTLPEFALKLTTGNDFRQRLKRYLISKGLYHEPGETGLNKDTGRQDGESDSSPDSGNGVVPPASGSEH